MPRAALEIAAGAFFFSGTPSFQRFRLQLHAWRMHIATSNRIHARKAWSAETASISRESICRGKLQHSTINTSAVHRTLTPSTSPLPPTSSSNPPNPSYRSQQTYQSSTKTIFSTSTRSACGVTPDLSLSAKAAVQDPGLLVSRGSLLCGSVDDVAPALLHLALLAAAQVLGPQA